jgi:hypothetical protein
MQSKGYLHRNTFIYTYISFFFFFSKRNIRIVYIDLSLPIEEQAPLDLIVHKMTDIVSKMERGDLEAKKMYQRFIVKCCIKEEGRTIYITISHSI